MQDALSAGLVGAEKAGTFIHQRSTAGSTDGRLLHGHQFFPFAGDDAFYLGDNFAALNNHHVAANLQAERADGVGIYKAGTLHRGAVQVNGVKNGHRRVGGTGFIPFHAAHHGNSFLQAEFESNLPVGTVAACICMVNSPLFNNKSVYVIVKRCTCFHHGCTVVDNFLRAEANMQGHHVKSGSGKPAEFSLFVGIGLFTGGRPDIVGDER